MDADTLLINPALAIHNTLPPPALLPKPMILAEIDVNGFCNGIIMYSEVKFSIPSILADKPGSHIAWPRS